MIPDETMVVLVSLAERVDDHAGNPGHSRRVSEYVRELLDSMAHIQDRGIIEQAARLHDIGMMGLPKRLLQKVEPLTADERARISTHAQRGGNSLISQYDTREVGYLVLHHHERIDGQGYPNGLKADAIPFGSRVIAVAEAFDAMTQHAAYHEGMNVADALKTLTDGAGKQWDQRIVVAFVRHCIPRLRQQHRLVVP